MSSSMAGGNWVYWQSPLSETKEKYVRKAASLKPSFVDRIHDYIVRRGPSTPNEIARALNLDSESVWAFVAADDRLGVRDWQTPRGAPRTKQICLLEHER